MRHLKAGKRLGVTTSHRKAMMRNLVTALLEHGEIKTTITRAKEMRKYFDKMIGLGKKQDLHSRRQALAFVKSKEAISKLFNEYGPLYEDRNGGYTRIYRLGQRLGDNAQMALIQMVDLKDSEPTIQKEAPEAIEEIKTELQSEEEAVEKTVTEEPVVESAVSETEEPVVEAAVSETEEIVDEPETETTEEPVVDTPAEDSETTEAKEDSGSKSE